MAREPRRKIKLVEYIEFFIEKNGALVVSFGLFGYGLGRVVIFREGGKVGVRASGHTPFEYGEPDGEHCHFLGNKKEVKMLEDFLESKFWGQFTFGELDRLMKDKKLRKELKRLAKELAEKFTDEAVTRLNALAESRIPRLKKQ